MGALHSCLWMMVALSAMARAGTPGSFRGTIVEGPQAGKDWIYVQGRAGMARRVEISHARVTYDDSVSPAERGRRPEEALVAGTEVRVTAEQGGDGEWRAISIEILKPAGDNRQSSLHIPPAVHCEC